MKKEMNVIIVVEGKSDVAFLSSFITSEFVITNGSDVPEATISYLLEQSHNKDIIVLTDPDAPGEKIRHKLDSRIAGLKHCYVLKKDAIKKHKVGIAETTKTAILEALNFPVGGRVATSGNLKPSDILDLGLIGGSASASKRERIANHFHLGHVNGKQFLKRINSLNITRDQLQEDLCEIH